MRKMEEHKESEWKIWPWASEEEESLENRLSLFHNGMDK